MDPEQDAERIPEPIALMWEACQTSLTNIATAADALSSKAAILWAASLAAGAFLVGASDDLSEVALVGELLGISGATALACVVLFPRRFRTAFPAPWLWDKYADWKTDALRWELFKQAIAYEEAAQRPLEVMGWSARVMMVIVAAQAAWSVGWVLAEAA